MAEPHEGGTPSGAPESGAPAPVSTPNSTQAPDVAALRAEIEAELSAQMSARLKELTGHESFEDAAKAKAKADAEQLAEQGRYKELAEAAEQRAAEYQGRFETAAIRSAILGAAVEAVDPDTVHALLAGQAKVSASGEVTVGGKPAAEAVAGLLKDKPFLAKPAGGEGSGSGGGGSAPAAAPKRADYASDIDYSKAAAAYHAQPAQ